MAEVRKEVETGAETVAVTAQSSPVSPGEAATLVPAGAAPPAEDRPSVPGFEIIEELGRGGMGVVYKARQVSLNRFVALKMILAGPYAGADHLARFRLEAEAVARLQHSGIVHIHEIGTHAGRSYLALEYVAGGTLTCKCAGRPLPAPEAARLVESLARAVQYAHQRGIVHRDLKPGNVLLTEDGQPKITDFGLAKRLDVEPGSATPGPQTQSGAILGTPAYMAPEQAGGKRGAVGPLADVYALGAILYELLTGRPPFLADNPVDVVLKVVSEEVVPPRRLEPGCPRDLEAVCLKCLEKDPARRYPSAEALADDLRRFLAGEPTAARPPGRGERLRRWAWRRRWWLAGGAAAACLLLLLTCSLAFNLAAVFWVSPSVHYSAPDPVAEAVTLPEPPVVLPDDLDLVPRDAVMFVTVRVADLWKREGVKKVNQRLADEKLPNLGDWVAELAKSRATRPEDLERLTLVNLTPDPPQQSYVAILTTASPYPRDEFEAQLKKRGLKAQQFEGKSYFGPGPTGQENVCVCGDRTFVYSPREESLREWIELQQRPGGLPGGHARLEEESLREWIELQQRRWAAGGPLQPALDLAARGHHVVAGAAPPRQLRDQLVRQLQAPPRGLPPEARLTQPDPRALAEIRTAALTADLKSRTGAPGGALDVELRLGYADEATAPKTHKAVIALWDFLAGVMRLQAAGALPGEGPPPVIAQELTLALRAARVELHGTEGRVTLKMEWAPNWPESAVVALKEESERVHSLKNLKQLGLAMHNYHSVNLHFPPAATTDKAGKPLLSWRVALLPFVEEGDLYRQFKLDEPWDGPNNKKLLRRMPAVYAPPLAPKGWEPNTTFYQVFTGEQTLFPPGKGMKLTDITDGTSNTLMIVEAFEPVPWTKPDDLSYSPAGKLPALGGIFHDGFQAVMADGRTGRFLPKNIPPATLRALITPRGGENVTPP